MRPAANHAGHVSMMAQFARRLSPPRATLYSKADCPLCHQAELAIIAVFGSTRVDVVDITGVRRLEDEFIFRIPVLVVNGRVLAEGRISLADARLARTIALDPPRPGERR